MVEDDVAEVDMVEDDIAEVDMDKDDVVKDHMVEGGCTDELDGGRSSTYSLHVTLW